MVDTKKREYRNAEKIGAEGEDESYVVEGYATTFGTEYKLYEDDFYVIRETVDKRAFDNADIGDCIMQYNHEGRVFARVSNGTLKVNTDERGLHVRADLSGTEIGRQLYGEVRGGYTTKMSFGFTVTSETVEDSRNNETGKREILRHITGVGKLYDVSAVSIPANDATEITARAYCEGVIAKDTEECRKKAEINIKQKQIQIMIELGG